MKRKTFPDPYTAVINRFNQTGVRYVVVGLAGINYYAKNPAETFGTLDYDLFIEPTLANVRKVIAHLQDMKFDIGTKTGVLNAVKEKDLKRIIREGTTLIATTSDGLMIEVLLKISGFLFAELERDAATFTVHGIPVRVGRLSKLLESKRIANRPKDRQFLKRYRFLLESD
ncbi:MAG: hypothetical protein A3C35_02900 [Omnitrophica bacterium RIFCSPHIGHO2_02_FULL_46_11]|nr:MAG: hypothetical protein A3C35_02900 [Omnitrophica bacterium RIFCSPHIGHO2_02_FULL_46_11]OGW84869.1 MAG: hypothetical protein A3A81_00930 [Omnitrophica bacterium RIFCSPLOWO2_01_FULL_45_10b]